ncbi:peptidoglycan-binding domain-containing protein [Kitasatospora sp. NPDC050463]|uniref:peptidoglycan-binding domain-containing protein n=1 Tax=Kitasatospora sp. NPDC050463 TaxID=3155786 RepID=UPI0033EA86EA
MITIYGWSTKSCPAASLTPAIYSVVRLNLTGRPRLSTQATGMRRPGQYADYIQYGDSGQGVRCVQAGLNNWNASAQTHTQKPSLVVDGVFGNATRNLLMEYQQWRYLGVDGVVGPDTGDTLYYTWIAPVLSGCYSVIPTKS